MSAHARESRGIDSYDLGILSPRIFTMMVLMALVTTAVTGPLLSLSLAWRPFHYSLDGDGAPFTPFRGLLTSSSGIW